MRVERVSRKGKKDKDTGERRHEENGDSLRGVKLRCMENDKKKEKLPPPPPLIFCICLNRPPGIESLSRFCLL